MKSELVKVKNQSKYSKNLNTGAIVLTSSEDIERARKAKEKRISERDRLNKMEEEIKRLTYLIEKLVAKNE